MITITTDRLLLRPLRTSDARRLAAVADDPRIAEHLRDGFPSPYAVRDARRFIQSLRVADPLTALGVVHDGLLIGCVGLTRGPDVYRFTGEVGYWLGVDSWGQGIATEVVGRFVEFVWRSTDLLRVQANVFSGNPGSERVLEKCGFVLESVQRRAVVKNGEVRDLAIWVRLRPAG